MAQYFKFNITNQQSKDPVIYTEQVTHIDNKDSKFSQDPSDKSYENLTLSIDNKSKAVLSTLPLTGEPTETNYHFKLSFRSGVLSKETIKNGLIAASDWKISKAVKGSFGAVSFYFLHTKAGQWKPGETLSFQLTDFTAVYSSRNASDRLTELVLVARNFKSSPKAAGPIKEINTLDIRIKNFLINRQLPLSLFFEDHNTVLNEESASNELNLQVHFPKRLAGNEPETDKIHFAENSRLSIAFDVAPDAAPPEATPWALSTVTLLQNCQIQAGDKDKTTWKPSKDNNKPTTNPNKAGQAVWTFEPAQAFSLAAGESLTFTISALQTGLPAGYTNLYLHYQDVPGYGSGSFTLPIIKSPLVTRGEKVGIGTNLPTEMLSIGRKEKPGSLALAGDKSFLQLGVGVEDDPDTTGIGKIGYNTNAPGLNIYGGGASGADRKIQFYNEGGAKFIGPVQITDDYTKPVNADYKLQVDGNVKIAGNVDSIIKVVVIADQIIGGPIDNLGPTNDKWEKTVEYKVTFKEKPQVYAVLQGYSAFGGTSDFNPYNSTAGKGTPGGGIGFAWVKVKEFTTNQATVHGFVSEGSGYERDNSLLFTLVAIGRV